MQKHEITTDLATRADLSEQDAETTMVEALTTIAKAMPADEARKAAAQLPTDFAAPLETATKKPSETDATALIDDLAGKLDISHEAAEERMGMAVATLRDALTSGEWVDVALVVPSDLLKLAPSR